MFYLSFPCQSEIMKLISLCTLSMILGTTVSAETDAVDKTAVDFELDYVDKSIKDAPVELFTEPTNKNNSIKYALYSPSNSKEACFFEPSPEEFDKCKFNPSLETEILIHGFLEILKPRNMFNGLKDTLLDHGEYNIIIVNWTLYNNFPLEKTLENIPKVGKKVAETVQFITNHTEAVPEQFHCIGHSYGAHVCGITARNVPNFYRVTGLDPGGIAPFVKFVGKDIVLEHTDASYVDVIHTSVIETGLGLGIFQPVGDMDFYVNGGIVQKHCKFGREYTVFDGDVGRAVAVGDLRLCNHYISIEYFTNSVHEDCEFLATHCKSLAGAVVSPVIKLCRSNSSMTTKMGFYSKKIQGLAPKSVFYVETLEFSPYCKDQK